MYLQALKILWPSLKNNKKLSLLVLSLVTLLVALSVAFNYWRGEFYNKIQAYDANGVFIYLGVFSGLAALYVLFYGLNSYFTRYLEFSVREDLFERYKTSWQNINVLNPEQRISNDLISFARLSIGLLKTIIDSSLKLPLFLFILFSIANWWVAGVLLIYAILGTIISRLVAKKLINLEYIQEQREAEFRKSMTYAVDSKLPIPTLEDIKKNWKFLAVENKKLNFFVSGYAQLGVILPYLMMLPLYLSKKIALGTLFQAASAADSILDSLSTLVNSRDVIVELSMVTQRISELETGDLTTIQNNDKL